jgi:lysozyme
VENWQDLIQAHEGFRSRPYCDKCGDPIQQVASGWLCTCFRINEIPGNITIGFGTNLSGVPLSRERAASMLYEAALPIIDRLSGQDWFAGLGFTRQAAIIDMAYCIGVDGLFKFVGMIAALRTKLFDAAADHILASKFESEAPARAADDAYIIRNDKYPDEQS